MWNFLKSGFCRFTICRFTICRITMAMAIALAVGSMHASPGMGQELSSTAPSPIPSDITWLVVRHAERAGTEDALTEAGHNRAKQLGMLAQILRVSAVYSTDFQRTRNTAQPTAEKNDLDVQLYEQVSAKWLAEVRKENASGVVLIVGHSNTVGPIVSELAGVEAFEIDHDQYDLLYVVKEQAGKPSLVQLQFGDSTKTANPATREQMGPIK